MDHALTAALPIHMHARRIATAQTVDKKSRPDKSQYPTNEDENGQIKPQMESQTPVALQSLSRPFTRSLFTNDIGQLLQEMIQDLTNASQMYIRSATAQERYIFQDTANSILSVNSDEMT